MNLDKIYVIDVGDVLDKKLRHKFITQHKWQKKFYNASKRYVFVPNGGIECFSPLFNIIYPEIRKIDSKIDFMSIEEQKEENLFAFALVQNKDRNTFIWHNHFLYAYDELHHGSIVWHPHKWSTVYYWRMPEGSGGIRFRENGKEILVNPKEGQLVIFPASLYHTPDINQCEDWRISININIADRNVLMRGNQVIQGDMTDWNFDYSTI